MKKRLKNDIVLVLSIALAALLAWGIVRLTRTDGEYVAVIIDGVQTAMYPLSVDTRVELRIEGSDEVGHTNTLVISGGKAYIEYADCPDKLCVKQPAINKAGESIICLPHKLVIRVLGKAEFDAAT